MIELRRIRRTALLANVLASLTIALVGEYPALADGPDLTVGAKEYPDANAVILRWDQEWTLAPDGTVHRRDHQWVKLLNRRPIGRYADRTIDFRAGEDTVIIHRAQTHLPDGQVMPVPDYSYNLGATEAVAGWPAYADWQQRIISFSGVMPEATLELDYEVVTQSGVLPCMSAEVRLDGPDPIHERSVRVTTPKNVNLASAVTDAKGAPRQEAAAGGATATVWRFSRIPAASAEALTPDWRTSSPKLCFSTQPDALAWTAGWTGPVTSAAEPDGPISEFAREKTKEALDARGRAEALVKALAERFNYLDNPAAWRSRSCRSASEVFASDYGNPLEAAAVTLAALRALEIAAAPAVAVEADAGLPEVPADDAFSAVLLRVESADGPFWLHPHDGVVADPGPWGPRMVLDPRDGKLVQTALAQRGANAGSGIDLSVQLTLADDGSATGKLSLTLSGIFAAPDNLKSQESQKKLIGAVVKRAVGDVKVTDFAVTKLSSEGFAATADIAADSLSAIQDGRLVQLGEGPVFLKDVALPLAVSERNAPVELVGPIDEHTRIAITWPKEWKARLMPQALARLTGGWGALGQTVEASESGLTVVREAQIAAELSPADFTTLRDALNRLRADGFRTIVAGR